MDAKNKSLPPPLVAIVDDDVSVRRSTRRLLHSAGLRAEAFASAEEFLMSGRAEETACLILDLRMPGMNGLQLQRRLADASNPVPIIFLSAILLQLKSVRRYRRALFSFCANPLAKTRCCSPFASHSRLGPMMKTRCNYEDFR